MFKFKMLTKVLVAVCFLGQIIELNLNMCIALSIDLDGQVSSIELEKVWQQNPESPGTLGIADQHSGEQGKSNWPTLASRTTASKITTTAPTIQIRQQEQQQRQQRDWGLGGKSISQTLESNGRFNYFGKIYVGEKKKPFIVLFDLTSSAFWLPSSGCKSFNCISRQKYDRSESATHQDTGLGQRDFTYKQAAAMTRVSTELVTDRLTFAGVTIEDQAFGEAIEVVGDSFGHLPVDGFLGLGFKQMAPIGQAGNSSSPSSSQQAALETPFERLYRMGLLKEPIFSLLVKNQVNEYMYSANNGELVLGELAPGYRPEDITYVPVTHVDYWEFRLTSVSLRQPYGGNELERACESACPAILDTSTLLISGHFTDVDRINRAMGGYAEGNGVYRLSNCDLRTLPDVVFTIGDAEFSLTPEEYVLAHKINGSVTSCHSAIKVVAADQYPFWILGEYFLKQHYVVFDYGQKRLGFAKSKSMVKEMGVDIYGRSRRKLHII